MTTAFFKSNTCYDQPAYSGLNPRFTRGLQAFWDAREGVGDPVDHSPLRRSCTLNGGLSHGRDVIKNKGVRTFDMDGTDDYLESSNFSELNLDTSGDEIGISIWFRRDAVSATMNLVSYYGTNNDGWVWRIGSGNTINFAVFTGAGGARRWDGTYSFSSTGIWHHVAFNFRAGTESSIKQWVDGVDDSGSWSFSGSTVATTASDPIRIGTLEGSNHFQNGPIAMVGLWNRLLTGGEVQALYQNPFSIYAPKQVFIPEIAATPGTAHPHYYMRRRYCA